MKSIKLSLAALANGANRLLVDWVAADLISGECAKCQGRKCQCGQTQFPDIWRIRR
jgi:hypothetical protein